MQIIPLLTSISKADSYAMYATWKYFEALFGTPDAVEVPRDEDDDPPEQHDGCEAHIALDSKQTPLLFSIERTI